MIFPPFNLLEALLDDDEKKSKEKDGKARKSIGITTDPIFPSPFPRPYPPPMPVLDVLEFLLDDDEPKPKKKGEKTRKRKKLQTSPYPIPQPIPPRMVEVDEICVEPVKGSVLYCDLVGVVEHSGIYIGKGRIVHLNGKGKIEIVTPESFVSKALDKATIYVSSNKKFEAVGSKDIAKLAKSMVGQERDYNFILDNCHQFTSGCITGEFENGDNYLWMLKHTAEKHMKAKQWLVWDKSDW